MSFVKKKKRSNESKILKVKIKINISINLELISKTVISVQADYDTNTSGRHDS